MVLSSPFGCCNTPPHPRQHLLVRNSDTATTSTLLDNRCWISFTGPLQPFPPRTLPKRCGRNPGFPNKTTVCRSLMLVVITGDVGLFEVSQAGDDEDDEDDEGSSVTGVVGKKRPSGVLCRFFCLMLICWKGVAFCVMKYRRFYQMMNKWAFAQQKWEIVFSFLFFALFPAFSVACCVIGFVFSKMDPRNLWGWNFDQYNRTKRMMATKREFDHKIVFSLVVSSCYTNRERDLK